MVKPSRLSSPISEPSLYHSAWTDHGSLSHLSLQHIQPIPPQDGLLLLNSPKSNQQQQPMMQHGGLNHQASSNSIGQQQQQQQQQQQFQQQPEQDDPAAAAAANVDPLANHDLSPSAIGSIKGTVRSKARTGRERKGLSLSLCLRCLVSLKGEGVGGVQWESPVAGEWSTSPPLLYTTARLIRLSLSPSLLPKIASLRVS